MLAWRACDHFVPVHGGSDIKCNKCGARWRLELEGPRWIAPEKEAKR